MSPGFFLNIAKNTNGSFSYGILPVKDVEDIPTHHIYPMVHNIVRPRDLDCTNDPRVKENNTYFTFQNTKGDGIFSEEELDPRFIPDRQEDIPYITEDEVRQLTSDHSSTQLDIQDINYLTRLDGRIPSIPEEPSAESLPEVLEEQSNDIILSFQCNNQVPECPIDITLEPVPKCHRICFDHPEDDSLPIIDQTQESKDYESSDNFEEDPVPFTYVDNAQDFDTLT